MKQETRSRTSRENIINAASECFAKIGYDQTDVEEICRRANLTKGAFYYHFSSKQDLFLEILDQWINRVAARIDFARMGASSVLEAIMGIPENFSPLFVEVGNQLPVFLEIYVKSLSDPDLKKTVLRSYKKFIMFFTNVLNEGIKTGSIRKIDPNEGAEILFSMTIGMLMQGLLRPRSRDWIALSKKTVKLLLAPQ
jgi:AcrR family transcriptional regulator